MEPMDNLDTSVPSSTLNPPWSGGATAGFGVLILVVFFITQFVASVAAVVFGGIDPSSNLGDITAIAIIASAVICTGLILSTLTGRYSVKTYLALQPVLLKTVGGWLFATIVFVLLGDRFIEWMERAAVPDFMIEVYTSAQLMPVLWFSMIIAAPVFEEVLFRGFLYEGFRHSRLGVSGAILIPTLIWTLLHASQYDVYYLSLIVLIGVLLGIARHRTGSLYVPLAMHVGNNLIATIQTMWALGDG